jgi:hypothetical protein
MNNDFLQHYGDYFIAQRERTPSGERCRISRLAFIAPAWPAVHGPGPGLSG